MRFIINKRGGEVRKKRKWFSLTAKDFDWSVYKGTGKGGQKRNKTSSAVMCKHPPSGAIGKCEDYREQKQNRKIAFKRCVESAEFQSWINLEIDIGLGRVKCESFHDGFWKEEKVQGDLKL